MPDELDEWEGSGHRPRFNAPLSMGLIADGLVGAKAGQVEDAILRAWDELCLLERAGVQSPVTTSSAHAGSAPIPGSIEQTS